MNGNNWALRALIVTALALSAHAQTFNWTLNTTGSTNPGNGSGTLTLTGGVVTAMSGTVGGNHVTLLPPYSFGFNDNKLPLSASGISLNVENHQQINVYGSGGSTFWMAKGGSGGGSASFCYTPVPEPST